MIFGKRECIYNCLKEKCPLWVVLTSDVKIEDKTERKQEGRCTFAWIPQLLIELRGK